MKKHPLLFPLLLLLVFHSGSSSAKAAMAPDEKAFQLTLHIKNFSNNYVTLVGLYGDQNFGLDSIFIDANGNGFYKRDSLPGAGLYLLSFPEQSFVQMIVDKERQFTLDFDKSDATASMKITGSLDNELLYKSLKFEAENSKKSNALQEQIKSLDSQSEQRKKLEEELQAVRNERKNNIKWFADNHPKSFFTVFKLAGQNPELKKVYRPDGSLDEAAEIYNYRSEFWNGYDFSDERLLRTPVYSNKLKRYIKEVTPQVADSIIKYADYVTTKSLANKEVFKFTANWIVLQYKEAKVMGRENIHVFMVEKFWTKDNAFWLKDYELEKIKGLARQMKPSLIGKVGQDVKGKNEKDQPIALYDIKSPFTILYIFSYDCDNCKKETPKLIKVYNEWKNRGLDVFTICIDGDKERWKEYLTKNGMTFHNIFDPENESNFRLKYYTDVTPEMYLLDKDHKIIASNIGSESVEYLLKQNLEKH